MDFSYVCAALDRMIIIGRARLPPSRSPRETLGSAGASPSQ